MNPFSAKVRIRTVAPQIRVGLMVDVDGFPLKICWFEDCAAEIITLIPVLQALAERHKITGLVVVTDNRAQVVETQGGRIGEHQRGIYRTGPAPAIRTPYQCARSTAALI